MDSNQIAVMSETWFGIISNPRDAFIIIEAARTNVLTRITRRLTDFERERLIRPGAVFCWEETEAGIKRWTDHIRWGPSRVKSVFLIYPQTPSEHDPSNAPLLFKQAFSSTTLAGEKFHIIAYYDLPTVETSLPRVSTDPSGRHVEYEVTFAQYVQFTLQPDFIPTLHCHFIGFGNFTEIGFDITQTYGF